MLAVLADAAPAPAFVGNAMLFIAVVIIPIISLAVAVIGIWAGSRRQPPLAEEVQKLIATLASSDAVDGDVNRLHERIDDVAEKFGERIEDLQKNLNRNQQDSDLARGRMEGKINMLIIRFFGKHALDEADSS